MAKVGITHAPKKAPAPPSPNWATAHFEYRAWRGISTTAGTPKAISNFLNAEVRAIFADPAFKEKWLEIGSEVVVGTHEQFEALVKTEARKMESLIKRLNIQLD